MKLLIIDDDITIHKALKPLLLIWSKENSLELNISSSFNGVEALNYIKKYGMPDLLFLDVRMPVMSGAMFLKEMKHLNFQCKTNTLLLSGYADDLENLIGKDSFEMHHLYKPFLRQELFEVLNTLYQKK